MLQWKDVFSFDGAIYYNEYNRLIGAGLGAPIVNPDPFYIVVPQPLGNFGVGKHTARRSISRFGRRGAGWCRPESRNFGVLRPRRWESLAGMPRQWATVESRLDLVHTLEFDSSSLLLRRNQHGLDCYAGRADTQPRRPGNLRSAGTRLDAVNLGTGHHVCPESRERHRSSGNRPNRRDAPFGGVQNRVAAESRAGKG